MARSPRPFRSRWIFQRRKDGSPAAGGMRRRERSPHPSHSPAVMENDRRRARTMPNSNRKIQKRDSPVSFGSFIPQDMPHEDRQSFDARQAPGFLQRPEHPFNSKTA